MEARSFEVESLVGLTTPRPLSLMGKARILRSVSPGGGLCLFLSRVHKNVAHDIHLHTNCLGDTMIDLGLSQYSMANLIFAITLW